MIRLRRAAAGWTWCVLAALAVMSLFARAEGQGPPHVVSVAPQMPPVEMYASWSPLLERLSAETGLRFRLRVYEKMEDFERDVRSGVPDFIFPNPVQMVMAHRGQGYVPLVRSSRSLAGVLFVRADSPIRTVQDLAGRDVAFVGTKNL